MKSMKEIIEKIEGYSRDPEYVIESAIRYPDGRIQLVIRDTTEPDGTDIKEKANA